MKSKIKNMKWQDVTIEQLKSHWDLGIKELPTPPDYWVASYMNAYAYGEIAGEGIDVRCEYADEVVEVFLKHIKSDAIHDALYELGWSTKEHDKYKLLMEKDNDFVQFEIEPENDNVGYMTMGIKDGYKYLTQSVSKDYYDMDEVTIDLMGHTQVVNERNIIDLFQMLCKKYFAYTEDAGSGMRNVNFGGHVTQVYPYNEYHNVWFLEVIGHYDDGNVEYNTHEIGDIAFNIQVQCLMEYEYVLKMKSRDNITFDGDYVVYVGADGSKRRYALVDNSHDRDVIRETILNLDAKTTNILMHRLGVWDEDTSVATYNKDDLFNMVDFANQQGREVNMHIIVLHDYFLFSFVNPKDDKEQIIQGLTDTSEEWESILHIDVLIDVILRNEDNFNIYKSVTNQK